MGCDLGVQAARVQPFPTRAERVSCALYQLERLILPLYSREHMPSSVRRLVLGIRTPSCRALAAALGRLSSHSTGLSCMHSRRLRRGKMMDFWLYGLGVRDVDMMGSVAMEEWMVDPAFSAFSGEHICHHNHPPCPCCCLNSALLLSVHACAQIFGCRMSLGARHSGCGGDLCDALSGKEQFGGLTDSRTGCVGDRHGPRWIKPVYEFSYTFSLAIYPIRTTA